MHPAAAAAAAAADSILATGAGTSSDHVRPSPSFLPSSPDHTLLAAHEQTGHNTRAAVETRYEVATSKARGVCAMEKQSSMEGRKGDSGKTPHFKECHSERPNFP